MFETTELFVAWLTRLVCFPATTCKSKFVAGLEVVLTVVVVDVVVDVVLSVDFAVVVDVVVFAVVVIVAFFAVDVVLIVVDVNAGLLVLVVERISCNGKPVEFVEVCLPSDDFGVVHDGGVMTDETDSSELGIENTRIGRAVSGSDNLEIETVGLVTTVVIVTVGLIVDTVVIDGCTNLIVAGLGVCEKVTTVGVVVPVVVLEGHTMLTFASVVTVVLSSVCEGVT